MADLEKTFVDEGDPALLVGRGNQRVLVYRAHEHLVDPTQAQQTLFFLIQGLQRQVFLLLLVRQGEHETIHGFMNAADFPGDTGTGRLRP